MTSLLKHKLKSASSSVSTSSSSSSPSSSSSSTELRHVSRSKKRGDFEETEHLLLYAEEGDRFDADRSLDEGASHVGSLPSLDSRSKEADSSVPAAHRGSSEREEVRVALLVDEKPEGGAAAQPTTPTVTTAHLNRLPPSHDHQSVGQPLDERVCAAVLVAPDAPPYSAATYVEQQHDGSELNGVAADINALERFSRPPPSANAHCSAHTGVVEGGAHTPPDSRWSDDDDSAHKPEHGHEDGLVRARFGDGRRAHQSDTVRFDNGEPHREPQRRRGPYTPEHLRRNVPPSTPSVLKRKRRESPPELRRHVSWSDIDHGSQLAEVHLVDTFAPEVYNRPELVAARRRRRRLHPCRDNPTGVFLACALLLLLLVGGLGFLAMHFQWFA
jgi:hypothetical protein